jgi:hypothetical protein
MYNSLQNPELSFYSIPKEETLKRKWHEIFKTKGLLDIKQYYRVCSAHFPDGKKTYINNIPIILTTSVSEKPRRQVVRNPDSPTTIQDTSIEEDISVETTNTTCTHENTSTETDIGKLKEQIKFLEAKCKSLENSHASYVTSSEQYLFRLERFISSDRDFQFYTGFPDYAIFKATINDTRAGTIYGID